MDRIRGFYWRPTTTAVLIGGFLLVLAAVVVANLIENYRPTVQVKAGSGVYSVWLADTEAERIQGLSGVSKLSPNGGLLMDFQASSTWGIWMKDMQVPLDIVWLSNTQEVVYIVKNVPADQSTDVVMQPKQKAQYVLELPAGSVDRSGIKTGQTVDFTLEGTASP